MPLCQSKMCLWGLPSIVLQEHGLQTEGYRSVWTRNFSPLSLIAELLKCWKLLTSYLGSGLLYLAVLLQPSINPLWNALKLSKLLKISENIRGELNRRSRCRTTCSKSPGGSPLLTHHLQHNGACPLQRRAAEYALSHKHIFMSTHAFTHAQRKMESERVVGIKYTNAID